MVSVKDDIIKRALAAAELEVERLRRIETMYRDRVMGLRAELSQAEQALKESSLDLADARLAVDALTMYML